MHATHTHTHTHSLSPFSPLFAPSRSLSGSRPALDHPARTRLTLSLYSSSLLPLLHFCLLFSPPHHLLILSHDPLAHCLLSKPIRWLRVDVERADERNGRRREGGESPACSCLVFRLCNGAAFIMILATNSVPYLCTSLPHLSDPERTGVRREARGRGHDGSSRQEEEWWCKAGARAVLTTLMGEQ